MLCPEQKKGEVPEISGLISGLVAKDKRKRFRLLGEKGRLKGNCVKKEKREEEGTVASSAQRY